MRGGLGTLAASAVALGLLTSLWAAALVTGVSSGASGGPGGSATPSGPSPSVGVGAAGTPAVPADVSASFDARVGQTAEALAAAGVPSSSIRLPYTGTPAEIVHGAVLPGYAVAAEAAGPGDPQAPAPVGIGYLGESDPAGSIETTTLEASSLRGTLTVDDLDTLYLDGDAPNLWGIQLNSVLDGVTLAGVGGYQFWVQNAVEYYGSNQTLNLGEDTWNVSSGSAFVPAGSSTVLQHSPNGSVMGGVYLGMGPWIHAPFPFSLTLYLNSSLATDGNQELWYNYSLEAAGGVEAGGNFDWLIFNSGAPAATPALAPFVASGTRTTPTGLPDDFELDYGIGGFNAESMDVLAANLTASLDYCPLANVTCGTGAYQPTPAAVDYGGQTGETSLGLAETYNGTTVSDTAGPFILRGLWGYAGSSGSDAGVSPVANQIQAFGDPLGSLAGEPYVFVFFTGTSSMDPDPAWAPDVPVWYLAPGTYHYALLLADYAAASGTLVVGSAPTALQANLTYAPTSGVYTPLWAFGNAELAWLASSGLGTISDQYRLFNNPTDGCTGCDGAPDGTLAPLFFSMNGYLYPSFPGILLDGTSAYVQVLDPVSFNVFTEVYGSSPDTVRIPFDLQLQFVQTEHVTLSGDAAGGGWPGFLETITLAGVVPASQNFFPEADVMFWNSSSDLVEDNAFVPSPLPPSSGGCVVGGCPPYLCYSCSALAGLLLYGGTNNTVWGNTFKDPAPQAGLASTSYAGLAEAESGDLIYNNNFSVDNPVLYLPYDVFQDACPIGYAGSCGPLTPTAYADSWNVTPQPADQVSAIVNGQALSGSVLGPACSQQGGNFWQNYGGTLNPTGQLPYVDRYNYTEDAALLPPGATLQNGIEVGGDAAPIAPGSCAGSLTLRLHATGLPKGSAWSAGFAGGLLRSSTTAWINLTVDPGVVRYTFTGPVGYAAAVVTGKGAPTFSSANLSASTELTVRFGVPELVTFNETRSTAWPGLPAGTLWGVTLSAAAAGDAPGAVLTTQGSSVSFTLVHGAAYRYVIDRPSNVSASPTHGSLTVPARAKQLPVRFRPYTAEVTFAEHGLARGATWWVTLTPLAPAGPPINLSGHTASLSVRLTNGTYHYAIGTLAPFGASPSGANLTVEAPHALHEPVAFAPTGAPAETAATPAEPTPLAARADR